MVGSLRGKGQITMCFYEEHEPLKHLTTNGSALRYRTNAGGRHERPINTQWPLLTHANGMHKRLEDAFFRRGARASQPI